MVDDRGDSDVVMCPDRKYTFNPETVYAVYNSTNSFDKQGRRGFI